MNWKFTNIVLDTFQEHLVAGMAWLYVVLPYSGNKVEVIVSFFSTFFHCYSTFVHYSTFFQNVNFIDH